jgi:hypothetical protein
MTYPDHWNILEHHEFDEQSAISEKDNGREKSFYHISGHTRLNFLTHK